MNLLVHRIGNMSSEKKLRVCQYGTNCYRKNPLHFNEYSHPHLDKIYRHGVDPITKKYTIPEEYSFSSEIITLQLKLLEGIFPKVSQKPDKFQEPLKKEDNLNKQNSSKDIKNDISKESIKGKDNSCVTIKAEDDVVIIDDDTDDTSYENKQQSNNINEKVSVSLGDNRKRKYISNGNNSDNSNDFKNKKLSISGDSSSSTDFEDDCKPSTSSAAVKKTAVTKKSQAKKPDNRPPNVKPNIDHNIEDYIPVIVEKGKMAQKLEKAAPYNFFLTAITDSKLTHNEPLTVTLQEIFDKSLGEIESTVQINFMVDIVWLLGHYYFAGILGCPLLVLYGDESPELRVVNKYKPQVTAIKVVMTTPFSTSHTKMMLIAYKDRSMRVVISTANLYEDDWHNRTQGIWISPKLPFLSEDADTNAGESPTDFKRDLMLYLVEYKIAELQPWLARIRKSDFGAINVFFLGSVPGGAREGLRGYPWGHARLANILQQHSTPIDDKISVVCQSSSIGSLGQNVTAWIQQEFINSLRKDSKRFGLRHFPPFKMIYPSFGNVTNSHDGMLGGGCLPYSASTNNKQPWLREFLNLWNSSKRYRSQAMPHIKSYTRFDLEENNLYWFVLTSANLSKAAWGSFTKKTSALVQPSLRINNYEAGVVFMPRFVIGEETFPLGTMRNGIPPFPLPYDVPLSPYGVDDKPFLMDYLH